MATQRSDAIEKLMESIKAFEDIGIKHSWQVKISANKDVHINVKEILDTTNGIIRAFWQYRKITGDNLGIEGDVYSIPKIIENAKKLIGDTQSQ